MAKSRNTESFWRTLASAALYKRNQGRRARQATAVAAIVVVGLGAIRLAQGPLAADTDEPSLQERFVSIGIPMLIGLAGVWGAYRAVNHPRVADFLISVDAEMDKVSWPKWPDLRRATIVVLSTMLFLGLVLFLYDVLWQNFFELIHVLQISG